MMQQFPGISINLETVQNSNKNNYFATANIDNKVMKCTKIY